MPTGKSKGRALRRKSQEGVALVFTALVAVVVLALIFLALDVALLSTSNSKLQYTANSACIGALNTYLNSTSSNPAQRRIEAWTRARALSGINMAYNTLADQNQTYQNELGYRAIGGSVPTDPNGYLEFGEWLSGSRAEAACPSWARACFRPLQSVADKITAIRINYRTGANNSIKLLLAKFFKLDEKRMRTGAVCSMIPRYAIVLPDLSRSSSFDTHIPLEAYRALAENSVPNDEKTKQQAREEGLGPYTFSISDEIDGVPPRTDTHCMSDDDPAWSETDIFSCTYRKNPDDPATTVTRAYTEHMNPCLDNPVPEGELYRFDEASMPPLNTAVPRGHSRYKSPFTMARYGEAFECKTGQPCECEEVAAMPGPEHVLVPPYFSDLAPGETVPSCPSYWEGHASIGYGLLRNARGDSSDSNEHFRSDYRCWRQDWNGFPSHELFRACYDKCLWLFPLDSLPAGAGELLADPDYRGFSSCLRGLNPGAQECGWSRDGLNATTGEPNGTCHHSGCEYNGHYKLVDTYVDFRRDILTGDYFRAGPEPFASFMRGTKSLLEIFEERAIEEDLVGMLGFDRSSKYVQRYFKPSPPGSKMFRLMEELTDIDAVGANAMSGWVRGVVAGNPAALGDPALAGLNFSPQLRLWTRHVFFPGSINPETNVSRALRYALKELATQSEAPGQLQRDVIVMSDMLGNCVNSTGAASEFNDTYTACADRFDYYLKSKNEIEHVVDTLMVPNGVALNVVLTGATIAPHLLLKCDGRGGVIDPGKAIRLDLPDDFTLVDYGTETEAGYKAISKDSPFYGPNYVYNLTYRSKGLFLPLREPCRQLTYAMLEAACESAGTAGQSAAIASIPGEVDGNGRILCDPLQRTKVDQVRDFMTEIMMFNTLRLVGPETPPPEEEGGE